MFVSRCIALLCLSIMTLDASANSRWGLNDVSYLLPLGQTKDDVHFLLNATDVGPKGQLLPLRIFEKLRPLLERPAPDRVHAILRVVAFRVDPCFQMTKPVDGKPECQKQLRLIWQPIRQGNAIDATIHTFYKLSAQEFSNLLSILWLLKTEVKNIDTDDLPLTVHPVMQNQGLSGSFWRQLKQILLTAVGEKNLVRATFMTLRSPGNIWEFGGVDVLGDQTVDLMVPKVKSNLQTFQNTQKSPDEFMSGPRMNFGAIKSVNLILRNSQEAKRNLTVLDSTRALDDIYKIENPQISTPLNTDCVSCHVAMPARHWIYSNYGELKLWQSPFEFKSNLNLWNSNPEAGSTRFARAFGYVKKRPLISQRVINESAQVAQALNSL